MVRLAKYRVFLGRNIYCSYPAIVGLLEIAAPESSNCLLDERALQARLIEILSEFDASRLGLRLHQGPRSDTLQEACTRLTGWLTAILQNAAGSDLREFGATRDGRSANYALSAYEVETVAHQAMLLACRILSEILPNDTPNLAQVQLSEILRADTAGFINRARRFNVDITTRTIIAAAKARNIPSYRISPVMAFLRLGQGAKQHHMHESMNDTVSVTGDLMAHDKRVSHHLLRQLGIPSPEQISVATVKEAEAAATRIGYPVVVKPSHGLGGSGVTVGVKDAAGMQRAFDHAVAARHGVVLVERLIPGRDHRLLVVGGKLIAAARRIPGHVVGNGVDTVERLIETVNRDPRRGVGYASELVKLVLDDEAIRMLTEIGLTAGSVPAPGEVVYLRAMANVSSGGIAVDVTETMHPDVVEMAEWTARAFKLEIAGLDYITEDITRSYRDVGGAICEVNSRPGLRPHWVAGTNRTKLTDSILQLHFPPGETGRIPVVAITGSSGKTTTARMVTRILEASGAKTALACSDGVMVGDRVIREGDSAGSAFARMALFDPDAEAAVLELARGGLIRSGVPIDSCDVATVLNVTANHLGQDGISTVAEMAKVKSIVIDTAKRFVVLNADDARCVAMANTAPAPVCGVSEYPHNRLLRAHTRLGGRGATLVGTGASAEITLLDGIAAHTVLKVGEIPATWGGALRANVLNALFAAAIGHCLGIDVSHIRAALRTFTCEFDCNPGRFNLLAGKSCPILLDRADSPTDIGYLCAAIKTIAVNGQRILAFTGPGNRRDDHLMAMGRAAAGSFDNYICYTWNDRRGRRPEEVPALLARGLKRGGVRDDQIAIIPAQSEAIKHAIGSTNANDFIALICYGHGADLRRVLDDIKR